MANNQYVNKVIFGDETLIDLSSDTVTANRLMAGLTAHDKTGAIITGTVPELNGGDLARIWQNGIPAIGVPTGIYLQNYFIYTTPIYIAAPSTGTRTVQILVPNGVANPTNEDEWIPITFTVDSSGNSEITDDTIPATGVSF